jgi:hypothetical protein
MGIWISARCQAANAGQRRKRLRLGSHAAAERFAAGNQGEPGAAPPGFRHRGAHRSMGYRRRIGPLAAALHIGKLVAQCRNAAIAEAGRDHLHRRMRHAGAGPVREHVGCARPRGQDQQRGDRRRIGDRDLEFLLVSGFQIGNPRNPASRM